jgi:hypothetical protein
MGSTLQLSQRPVTLAWVPMARMARLTIRSRSLVRWRPARNPTTMPPERTPANWCEVAPTRQAGVTGSSPSTAHLVKAPLDGGQNVADATGGSASAPDDEPVRSADTSRGAARTRRSDASRVFGTSGPGGV